MYKKLLEELEKTERFPLPSDESKIQLLKKEVESKFAAQLPQEYLSFLRLHNGLNWNGLFIYAAEENTEFNVSNLVYENESLRIDDERFNDMVVFGDDDMSYYIYRITAKEFQVLDKIPLDVMNRFAAFDELLTEAFESKL